MDSTLTLHNMSHFPVHMSWAIETIMRLTSGVAWGWQPPSRTKSDPSIPREGGQAQMDSPIGVWRRRPLALYRYFKGRSSTSGISRLMFRW